MAETATPTWTHGPDHALLVVDMQHDFGHPDGSLYVRGGEEIVEPINRAIQEALAAGHLVVYTRDWHPQVTPHFAEHGGLWPAHCVIDSAGAQFLPGITVNGPVVHKGSGPEDGYSGFAVLHLPSGRNQETELSAILDENGVMAVTVVGLAGDWCVKSTAIDAVRLGYRTIVPLALTRFVELNPGDTKAAIGAMRDGGVDVVEA
ncbi:MAG TPA: isochorismatase family protein [Nakamurella sp.]